jgi:hypothetical protein
MPHGRQFPRAKLCLQLLKLGEVLGAAMQLDKLIKGGVGAQTIKTQEVKL